MTRSATGNHTSMSRIFRCRGGLSHDPGIEVWMREHGPLGAIARRWFDIMRDCGGDVRELLHDGHPTACLGNAFKARVNIGFFCGAELDDPERLLTGTGKFMRHVKLTPVGAISAPALERLIRTAYRDMRQRLDAEQRPG